MKNDLLLRTLRKEKTERIPVWFMRQEGRYLPDYIKLREKYSFFERVRNPQLAAEITVMPVKQVGVDAAILFSDILVIAQALGVEVEILEGKGPIIADPIRTKEQIQKLDPTRTEDILSYSLPSAIDWFLWFTVDIALLHGRRKRIKGFRESKTVLLSASGIGCSHA
jgi:uroporphyrinogen decarboxylase